MKDLKAKHEKIRTILMESGNEEYGDCIIDEICDVVGIPPTTVYCEEELTEIRLERYMSTYSFVAINNLKKDAERCFGKGWVANDDVSQIERLLDYVGRTDLLVRFIDNLRSEEDIEVYSKKEKLSLDDIKDLSVRIVGDLVLKGLIIDCTDTENENEFVAQDTVKSVLGEEFGYTNKEINE